MKAFLFYAASSEINFANGFCLTSSEKVENLTDYISKTCFFIKEYHFS